MSDKEAGEKSEKATPKRMKELHKEGSLQRSQDVSAWLVIGAAALTLPGVLAAASASGTDSLALVEQVIADPKLDRVVPALEQGLGSIVPILGMTFVAVVLAAVIAGVAQGGLHISTKKLKPTFKQFNVVTGAKRLFGPQAWWQGGKAALKAAAIGIVLYVVVQGIVPLLIGSGRHSLTQILGAAGAGVNDLIVTGVAAGLLLAAADVFVVMKRNQKKTRMSKKEIKDEYKKTEGDPMVKGQIRNRQMAMSRNRMLAELTEADVVLVNPTHVAVALRYEPGTGAPRVIAKGKGHIATKIRERATAARIPLVEDVPLARALHSACDLGQEIPPHLYQAVARILAFVMALKRRGAAAGTHRPPGGPTQIEEAA